MKTLIVHPADPTTTFLSRIYAHLNDKTVVTGGISKSELRNLIESHEKLLFLGHGSPYGLLSKGQFPDAGLYIVDVSIVPVLKIKSNCMFIWCYADQFVQRHGLSGLCTGMFISELGEADYWGFENINQVLIDQSNDRFTSVISKYMHMPLELLFYKLLYQYELLSRSNQIARFNLERLSLLILGKINIEAINSPYGNRLYQVCSILKKDLDPKHKFLSDGNKLKWDI